MATSVTLEAFGTGIQTTAPVVPGQVPRLSLSQLDPRKAKAAISAPRARSWNHRLPDHSASARLSRTSVSHTADSRHR
jgi:hypothetical protein